VELVTHGIHVTMMEDMVNDVGSVADSDNNTHNTNNHINHNNHNNHTNNHDYFKVLCKYSKLYVCN